MGAYAREPRARKRGVGNMVETSDETTRERFATEIDRNFSVIASAGPGKTTEIPRRVLSIPRSKEGAELLPHLGVAPFPTRLANEMQQRARQVLLEENLRGEVQTAFNRAFF